MTCTIGVAVGQDSPVFEGGDGPFAAGPDRRVAPAGHFLPAGQLSAGGSAVRRGVHATVGALVALAGERHHLVAASDSRMPWARTAVRSCVEPGTGEAQTSRSAVSAMTFTLTLWRRRGRRRRRAG